MKVLVVHNYYRSSAPSGEDAVVRDEIDLLRRSGVEVVVFERHNDDIPDGPVGLLRTAGSTVWSRETRRAIAALIVRERPDVAHFHNLWYLVSASAYEPCREAGIPVVQTLHNFRMFCANGLLLRDGAPCEDCVGHIPWKGALHGCYESRLRSIPVVVAEAAHRLRRTWARRIDAFIVLSEFAKEKFVACGLPRDRMVVKPNSCGSPLPSALLDEGYGVYVGRLSREKGVETLVRAAVRSGVPLRIVGDGPLRGPLASELGATGCSTVQFLGRLDHAAALRVVASSSFLVSPSICYENFPRAIVEAFALERPVITSRLGAPGEIVVDGETGLLCAPGDVDDLATKMRRLAEAPEVRHAMGMRAREAFARSYAPERNTEMLLEVYRTVTDTARGRAASARSASCS